DLVNPTVALNSSSIDDLMGRFVVAWNATPRDPAANVHEIHAQYFCFGPYDAQHPELAAPPIARGRELRVNQETGPASNGENRRTLAESAQHTITIGRNDQLIATWTRSDTVPQVMFTMLGHDTFVYPQDEERANCPWCIQYPEYCFETPKGDLNGDG